MAGLGGAEIHGSKDRVILGKKAPSVWLVVDERTLGSCGFAKSLRQYLAEHPLDLSVGIVRTLSALPDDEVSGATVVVAGSLEGRNQEKMRRLATAASKLILLAPAYYPQEMGFDLGVKDRVEICFGEFSQSAYLTAWEETGKVRRIAGTGDFLSNWVPIVFGEIPGHEYPCVRR